MEERECGRDGMGKGGKKWGTRMKVDRRVNREE